MIKIIKPVFVFTLLILAIIAPAQNNTHSPYSARGLGEQEPFSNTYNRSLGGVSNGIRSTRFISLSNPASLSGLKQVVFDFGFTAGSGKMSTQQATSTYYNGNFNYVVLGFPVWQKEVLAKDTSRNKNKSATKKTTLIKSYRTIWSSAIGMSPYSSLGTSSYKTTDTTYGKLSSYYEKSGGLSNLFLMNAVNLSKNISLGLNASYIFGQVKSGTSLVISDSGVSRLLEDNSSYYLHGFKFDIGLQTQHHDTFTQKRIKRVLKADSTFQKVTVYEKVPVKLILGGTIYNQSTMRYSYNRLALNKSNYYLLNPADTVINSDAKGSTFLPGGFSAGFSLRYNNLWLLAFDYSSNFYARIKNPLFNDKYTNSSQFNLGIAYKPDMDVDMKTSAKNKKDKASRIEYRAGFRYFNTGYNFKDNTGTISPLIEYAITTGIGIPIIRTTYVTSTRQFIKSSFNLGLEYVHRGTTKNGMA